MKHNALGELFNGSEAAEFLGVAQSTFSIEIAPQLRGVPLPRRLYYKKADLQAWLREREQKATRKSAA